MRWVGYLKLLWMPMLAAALVGIGLLVATTMPSDSGSFNPWRRVRYSGVLRLRRQHPSPVAVVLRFSSIWEVPVPAWEVGQAVCELGSFMFGAVPWILACSGCLLGLVDGQLQIFQDQVRRLLLAQVGPKLRNGT